MSVAETHPEISHEEFVHTHRPALKGGGVLFHAQLFPGVYPPDQAAHEERRTLPESEHRLPEWYLGSVKLLGRVGIGVKRLLILPDVNQAPDMTPHNIRTILPVFRSAQEAGEEVRVSWFSHQLGRLTLQLESNPYVKDYHDGAVRRIPQGSFWAAYHGDGELLGVEYMRYITANSLPPVIDRRHVAPPDSELRAYVGFWTDVFRHPRTSLNLDDALAIPPEHYPKAI